MLFWYDLEKIEFSRQTFEKYWHIKLQKNLSVEAKSFHVDRRTDRRKDGQTDRETRRSE
jgi:hypothetical protein